MNLELDEVALLFALRRESGPFLREFRPQQRFDGAPCPARFYGPDWLSVLVLETGVGPKRAQMALDWLLGRPRFGNLEYRPKLVLSVGFAGALHTQLKVGDIVVATELADMDGNLTPAPWPGNMPPGDWQPPLTHGRIVSAPNIVATPADKQKLSEQAAAIAVDMESATLARGCHLQGIPFGCVRAISDDAQTTLSPRLVKLLDGGRASPLRAAAAVLMAPSMAGELMRLARSTSTAARQLALALGELLTLTLPGGEEL